MFNSFIKSFNEIEISSEDISLTAFFCFPRNLFRYILTVLAHATFVWFTCG